EGGGQWVSGGDRVGEGIGRGGMGIVWRARDELLDREVAVKEIRTSGLAVYPGCPRAAAAPHQVAHALGDAESADVYQRALREAKAAARLNHPGGVTVFDIVEEDGGPFIIMELVPARALDRLIAG